MALLAILIVINSNAITTAKHMLVIVLAFINNQNPKFTILGPRCIRWALFHQVKYVGSTPFGET